MKEGSASISTLTRNSGGDLYVEMGGGTVARRGAPSSAMARRRLGLARGRRELEAGQGWGVCGA